MQYFALRTHTDQSHIFDGKYSSFIDCLQDAITQNINLSYIDLRHKNLTNANLDNAIMPYANFSGANLTGANLSESILTNAIYINATLYNTCLSYSDLKQSDFRGASFGATLIEGCDITKSTFSTLSCFNLNFSNTESMHGCIYESSDGYTHNMSYHPIVVQGLLSKPLIIMDHTIALGTQILPRKLLKTIINATSELNLQNAITET